VLEVEITDGDSTEMVATLTAPALVGHIGVVDHGPRTASVLARGPATVLRLSRGATEALIAADTLEGERFRELLLAGMFRSLTSSTSHLRALLAQQPGTVELRGDGPDSGSTPG
jgi:CRP-like cAMP-binding protein